ncbi:MAG: hypothetical protein EBY17_20470 [Acidobacteriia bacterium]|nr:hypothetical protein [Terriglobia bacterium]
MAKRDTPQRDIADGVLRCPPKLDQVPKPDGLYRGLSQIDTGGRVEVEGGCLFVEKPLARSIEKLPFPKEVKLVSLIPLS